MFSLLQGLRFLGKALAVLIAAWYFVGYFSVRFATSQHEGNND